MKYKEIWKPIRGFETRYSISNYGRIKSIERYMVSIHDTGLKRRIHAGQWRKGSNCERITKEEIL